MRLIFLLLLSAGLAHSESLPCKPRTISDGKIVCVCDANYCDTIETPELLAEGSYVAFTSNKAGLRFEKTSGSFQSTSGAVNIKIDTSVTYQTIEGFGGAFTDATGINLKSLSEIAQEKLLNSYFSKEGLEYSLCRVPIGGTDFSTRGYSYDDGEVDADLNNFQLTSEDFDYKIPVIQKAYELTNNKLQFIASAWTAPKWMKTNDDYGGFLSFLKDEYYQTWVDYFLKFFDAYKTEGINFWGLTTGNEPSLALFGVKNISSVAWTPSKQQKWIAENLGPTIRNSEYSHLKIMALDDQILFLPWYIELLFRNETVENYIDGIAVHWYWDKYLPATLLTATHDKFPEKFLIGTEASVGDKPWEQKLDLGSWSRGEEYATDIIRDLNHFFIGWLDWNMALDLNGGPTYVSNSVDCPIIVNATADEFYKQPMYYALGHFSKFIPKGSVRVKSDASYNDNVQVVAVKRPDDAIVAVILNKNWHRASLIIEDLRRGKIPLTVSKRSITTIIYK